MNDTDLWSLEERLWLEGADAYGDLVAPDALMAFAPIGILQGDAITESLAGAPRWTTLALTGRAIASPDAETRVLAYHARASRADAAPYAALCTSTWRRHPPGWRLVQHRQTPEEPES